MRLFRITNGFDRMTDAYLLVWAKTIRAGVANHADYFPNPTPSLNTIDRAIAAFTAALQAAEGGDRLRAAEKDAARAVLIDNLHLLGNFVLFAAGGGRLLMTMQAALGPMSGVPLICGEGNGLSTGILKKLTLPCVLTRPHRFRTPEPINR